MIDIDVWNRTTVDWAPISDGLLRRAKAESRIDHDRDDDLVTAKVQAAADMIEREANVYLAPATYEADDPHALGDACGWYSRFHAWGVLLPFNNVRAARLFDADDNDITGDWRIRQREFGSNRDAYLVSPTQTRVPTFARVEFDVGVESVADIAPLVVQVLLRIAASLYEYREAADPIVDAERGLVVARFDRELQAIWRPCV